MKINIGSKRMINILLSLSLLCLALAVNTAANAKPTNNDIKDRLEIISQQFKKTHQEINGTIAVDLDSIESDLTIDSNIFILNNPNLGE